MAKLVKILNKREMGAQLVTMIHDSIWVEATAVETSEVRELIRTIMTNAGKLDVPLAVDLT